MGYSSEQPGAAGRSVAFITLGCAKNEVDSSHMAKSLEGVGYVVLDDPEDADVVVVNTCSFIQTATEESIDAVLEAARLPRILDGSGFLVVAGCMPARYGEELAAELPEASLFLSCAEEAFIGEKLEALYQDAGCGGALPGSESALPGQDTAPFADADPERFTAWDVYAYVKISDGCDRFCSYCTIPYFRGRYHSFTLADIRAEVASHVGRGVREIVLIAQDTGRWGQDFAEPQSLAYLLGALAEEFPETWFRVMYLQPEGVTDELVEAVATHPNICSYLDIPFQHANGELLRAMNRHGSAQEFLDLIAQLRARIPGVALRTTLIAGFPGETDEMFQELCDFVEEAQLDYVGVFAYSREEGTRAHGLPGQVEEDEKAWRAQHLRDLADAVCTARIAERIGSDVDVLVCGAEEDGQLYGRAMCQSPDVDGVTYLPSGTIGQILPVRITDTLMYEMEGEVR